MEKEINPVNREISNGVELLDSYFSDEEDRKTFKAEAFERLEELFFDRNFGATSKSEIELMMFDIFMKAMIDKNNTDGVLNYNECSDYAIGKYLGITPEKVRSLKLKKQARYPEKFDWKKSLEEIKERIRYDQEKNRIVIPMPDPNLYNEIRNYIENNNGYIEIQRGNNVLQIRPDCYFDLLYMTENEDNKKKLQNAIVKKFKKQNEEQGEIFDKVKTDKERNCRALKLGKKSMEFLAETVESIESLTSPLALIVKFLASTFEILTDRYTE